MLRFRPSRPAPSPASASYDLIKATRSAMGSYFEVRLPFGLPAAADLATRALDRIDELEDQLTVYRDTSEVAKLNASAGTEPRPVEPGLFRLLQRAVDLCHQTGGAYDVTSGALSLAWGFTRGPRRVPDPQTLAHAREVTGSHHLRLDPDAQTLAIDREGVLINLGSIGKGYAIDEAVRLISNYWIPTSALVHGGRSSLYALGSPPGDFGGRWDVAVYNPQDPERPLGTMHLRDRGMGTSGASFQQFEDGGRAYGHIIDPRTGEPPESGPLCVCVVAPSAAEADALSTAFYLIGVEQASKIVRKRSDLGALFALSEPGKAPKLISIGLGPLDFTPTLL